MNQNIDIGIAGWSYDDWYGIVYEKKNMDELAFVSQFVDCIEINTTFYRPPSRKNTQSWLSRTAHKPDFFFTAKLSREITHEGRMDSKLVNEFYEGFEPMLIADKLRHLLAQFRYDFDDTAENRKHLEAIARNFGQAFSLIFELRHISWQNQPALDFLQSLGISVCNLDYPISSNSFDMQCCTLGKHGYFRMHGRNYEKWFTKSGRDQTYDYYYSKPELDQIRQRLQKLADAFDRVTAIANNHYHGAELANAIELKHTLTGRKFNIPDTMLDAYPDLNEMAVNRKLL